MLALAIWDRTSLSLGAIKMNADLGLSAGAFGLGAGLFFVLYVLLEVPSNVVMARVGARWWMSRIMVSWGLVTLLTAFIQNEFQFYGARLLLGAAEAGFWPGMILYISSWYPNGRRSRAISIFATGALLSPLVLNPTSGWILGWDFALPGWRWLFLVSGAITVVVGAIAFKLLPATPAEARWLTAEERAVIEQNGAQPTDGDTSMRAQWAALKVVVSNRGIIGLAIVLFIILSSGYAVYFFFPTILAGYPGLSPFVISVLTAVPSIAAIAMLYLVGSVADRTRRYAALLVGMLTLGAAGYALMVLGKEVIALVLVGYTAGVVLTGCYPVPLWSMVTGSLGRPQQAAAVIALVNAVGISGGFFGPYLLGAAIDSSGGRWELTAPYFVGALAFAVAVVVAVHRTWRRHAVRNVEGVGHVSAAVVAEAE
jgi:MFS family permease